MTEHLATMKLRMQALQSRGRPAPRPRSSPAAMPDDGAVIWRADEAAERCRVSINTFKKWGIPRFKWGNVEGYRPEDVRQFIASHMVNSSPNQQESEPHGQSEH